MMQNKHVLITAGNLFIYLSINRFVDHNNHLFVLNDHSSKCTEFQQTKQKNKKTINTIKTQSYNIRR